MKNLELSSGRKIFLENFFLKCDVWIHNLLLQIKFWWSQINFKNTRAVIVWLVTKSHRLAVAIKRRFDHEQSHFFVKREHDPSKKKGSVSFFLKDVSDYKKSLREGREE